MVDVSSAIIQIQNYIIENQGVSNIFKTCIPPLVGVLVGVCIALLKDFIFYLIKNNKIKSSVETEFKQEVKHLKKCIKTTYLTIRDWSNFYENFSTKNKNIPKIIYAKIHNFLAFEKCKIDYYNK